MQQSAVSDLGHLTLMIDNTLMNVELSHRYHIKPCCTQNGQNSIEFWPF